MIIILKLLFPCSRQGSLHFTKESSHRFYETGMIHEEYIATSRKRQGGVLWRKTEVCDKEEMLPISERTQYPARPAHAICPIGQNLPDDPRASDPALEDHAVHLQLSKLLLLHIHNIYCQSCFRCIKGCNNGMFFPRLNRSK